MKLQFYLEFVSLGFADLYQIEEPVGSDILNFMLMQNTGRFSRDITYGADKKDLQFIEGNFSKGEVEQVKNPRGVISKYLDMGLDWLLESERQFGFESVVNLVLKKDGLLFTTGMLDFPNRKTDGQTYFSCAIIQNNNQADYKRHLEDTIDLFGTKNYKNENITPVSTIDFLRKAIPINKNSKFITPENFVVNGAAMYGNDQFLINPAVQLIDYGAETTYVPNGVVDYMDNTTTENLNILIPNKLIYKAKKRVNNFKIKLSELDILFGAQNAGNVGFNVVVFWGNEPVFPATTGVNRHFFYNSGIIGNTASIIINDEFIIPSLEIGQKVWFEITIVCVGVPSTTPVNSVFFRILNTFKIELFTTETSIDTIIKGVRYIEGIKQTSKYVNNLPVIAPRFDNNGQFYQQAIWNRSLISQNTNNKFNTSIKELMGSVEEVCADYEILDDKIFIGQYPDYYTNTEIGVFQIIPSKEFTKQYADNAQLNTFKFGYETFEQDRATENTKEDIHTDSEWGIPNLNVENKKEIKCKLVRSAFSQQVATDLEIYSTNTSDVNDDKVYIAEIIALPDGSFNQFGAVLNQRLQDGRLQILNRDSEGTNEDVVVNWLLLGLNVGQAFSIVSGANAGTYTVFDVSRTVLTLTIVSASVVSFGDVFSEFKFFYIGILWKTRGNEGFTETIGISNPETYPNLNYTIRRNMKHWESFINRSCQYIKLKEIVNRYFKNNNDVKTNFNGQGLISEIGNIPVNTLVTPLLSPNNYNVELVSSFANMLSILEALKNERGFVRLFSNNGKVIKGYIQKLDYTWKTNALKLTIEEKYENPTLIVTYADKALTISGTTYTIPINSTWWRVNDIYFQFLDVKSRPINNYIPFNLISLNGLTYNSQFELIEALNNL